MRVSIVVLAALLPLCAEQKPAARWWESAAAMKRMTLKNFPDQYRLSLKPGDLEKQLSAVVAEGFQAIEIFAAPEGGKSFHGLDAIRRDRIDPEAGSMEDFRRLVRTAHGKGLAVITFDNLGYSSVDAPDFVKACDDAREGRDSRQRRFYLWSDSKEAPAPGGDSYFMLPGQAGRWEWSERAGKFYWTKWGGLDKDGKRVRLPQYDWASPAWRAEVQANIRFWMSQGIDGMIIDAVNWYPNYSWDLGRRLVTDVINSGGTKFSQPEGAGGFRDDPVAWITEGGWNCVQDYGLGIWWEKPNDVVRNALDSGDPRPIERALRDYHDRVVAAGGVLYGSPTPMADARAEQLSIAMMATAGNMVVYEGAKRRLRDADADVLWLLKTKREHPALHQLSTRRMLPVVAADRHYAFLRTSLDGRERVLVVMNYRPAAEAVEVDLAGVAAAELVDLRTGVPMRKPGRLEVELPAFGYRIYQVKSSH